MKLLSRRKAQPEYLSETEIATTDWHPKWSDRTLRIEYAGTHKEWHHTITLERYPFSVMDHDIVGIYHGLVIVEIVHVHDHSGDFTEFYLVDEEGVTKLVRARYISALLVWDDFLFLLFRHEDNTATASIEDGADDFHVLLYYIPTKTRYRRLCSVDEICEAPEMVTLTRPSFNKTNSRTTKEYHEIDLILCDEEPLIVLYPRGMKFLPHAYEVPVLPLLKKWFPEAYGSTEIGSSP